VAQAKKRALQEENVRRVRQLMLQEQEAVRLKEQKIADACKALTATAVNTVVADCSSSDNIPISSSNNVDVEVDLDLPIGGDVLESEDAHRNGIRKDDEPALAEAEEVEWGVARDQERALLVEKKLQEKAAANKLIQMKLDKALYKSGGLAGLSKISSAEVEGDALLQYMLTRSDAPRQSSEIRENS
jgi:hypothetical protein